MIYSHDYIFDPEVLKSYDTGHLWLDIFLNNLFLCLIISVIGYFTGGFLTVTLLFWNGYILGIIYNAGFMNLSLDELIYNSKHLPFELTAIVLFSNFGLKGFQFYKSIILEKKFELTLLGNFGRLFIPTVLLLTSSIIETL